jgi:peptidoglycan/LPS O-acetylase OafA/YrhL
LCPEIILPRTRFLNLDALRGVAAICVLYLHIGIAAGVPYFGMGFFNVDLFFCLSGFVLTHAYKRRVYDGLGFKSFLAERMVRLYPTYVVGVLIGIVVAIISYHSADQVSIFPQSALAIFFVPDFASKELFPLNNPAWSLFFEVGVNILFFYLIFAKTWTNKAIILVSAVLYVAAVAHFRGAAGWGRENFIGGFPRVLYGFFWGCFLHSLFEQDVLSKISVRPIFPIVLIIVVSFLPTNRWFVYIPSAIFIVPLLIAVSTRDPNSSTWSKAASVLGVISYPLYIIHFPIVTLAFYFHINSFGSSSHVILTWIILPVFLVSSAAAIGYLYDIPVRKFVGRKILSSRHEKLSNTCVESKKPI